MPTRPLVGLLPLPLCVGLAAVAGGQTVTGRVAEATGEPVAYATVGVEGATLGVTTAGDGTYRLDLGGAAADFGDSLALVFRSIGYLPTRRTLAVPGPGREVAVDAVLREATYTLDEAVVSAGAEDPAYRIMREAAARRERYLTLAGPHEVDVYVKGQLYVADAPERILGFEIGDMGGLLDSSRAGIVYLSETYSELAVDPPDDTYETIVASKVSGDPRGYSFNTAAAIDFDLYRRVKEYTSPLLSPLADNAPGTYRFRLLGSRRDEAGRLVHRISVAPRGGDIAPGYHGEVYVEEGSFHLVDADLYLLGPAISAPGLDTLFVAASYRRRPGAPTAADGFDVWEVTQRRVGLVLSLMGFQFRGAFTGVYSDYDYEPDWAGPDAVAEAPFGRVRRNVLPESNAVDSARFAARPIPLTPAEALDYARKDSIRRVRESPAYRDSVERRGNRFGWGDVLTGYTYSDWRSRTSYTYASPLSQNSYHPATGLLLGAGVKFSKAYDEERDRQLELGTSVGYGIGDRTWYPTARVDYRWAPRYLREVSLEGGRELVDYHRLGPVDPFVNTFYIAFAKRSPLKLYERRHVSLAHATDLHRAGEPPLAQLTHALTLERRLPRENVDDWSLLNRDDRYEPNLPEVPEGAFREMRPATILRYAGEVSFVPGERFVVFPDRFVTAGGGGPRLSLSWRYGREVGDDFAEGSARIRYLFAALGARREGMRVGRLGALSARLGAGAALFYEGDEHPVDLQLFGGSELPVNAYGDYLTRLLGLPHYGLATEGPWVDGALEHHFGGLLWRRLPLLRRLRWQVVARAAGVVLPDPGDGYGELGVGLENIGFGIARFVRADVVWPYRRALLPTDGYAEGWGRPVWRVGVNVPLDVVME